MSQLDFSFLVDGGDPHQGSKDDKWPAFLELLIAPSADPVSKHCSAMGALKAQPSKAAQHQTLIAAYREHGSLTDAEMEDLTGIDRSTVIPRRTELIAMGKVEAKSDLPTTRRNAKTGINNRLWRLKLERTP